MPSWRPHEDKSSTEFRGCTQVQAEPIIITMLTFVVWMSAVTKYLVCVCVSFCEFPPQFWGLNPGLLLARQGLYHWAKPPGLRPLCMVPWFFSCKSSTRVCKLSSLFCSFRQVFPVVSSDGDCESIRKLLRCDIKSLFNIAFRNLQITC